MGRKNKKGKAVVKAPSGADDHDVREEEYKGAPHSFIFHRGLVGKAIKILVHDLRRVMEPFTAANLKVRSSNVLKDFVSVAGPLNISHFMVFTKTEAGLYLRFIRLPRGPTLTFKVEEYCLSKDIVSSLKKPNMAGKQFQHHPLLVMNNLSGEGMHLKLMASMFQNMFPGINVNKVKLGSIKRCVLMNFNKEDETIDFRHYNIKVVPVGMSRGIKKLVRARVPDMGRLDDVSDYLLKDGHLSESEAELDGPLNEVVLPQAMPSRGNIKAAKSAIRLTEIGPRLKLRLVKIQEGISDGEVLYHQFIHKTQDEMDALKKANAKKRKLKEKRKLKQQEDLKKKQRQRYDNKQRSLAGMKAKEEEESGDEGAEATEMPVASDDDDDEAYYKQEVGEAPDADLGLKKSFKPTKRRHKDYNLKPRSFSGAKRARTDKDGESDAKGKKPTMTEMERLKKIKLKKKQKKIAGRKKKGGRKPRR